MTTTTTQQPATAIGHHQSDDPLELHISSLIAQGKKLAWELFNAHARRAAYKYNPLRPAWKIREEISRLDEELELSLSEWESRRI